MSFEIINRIISGLFLVDYIMGLYLLISILSGTSLTDFFAGGALLLYLSRICLYVILGFLVIWALFFNRIKKIYIATALYVTFQFLSRFWLITPNGPKFQNIIKEMQQSSGFGAVFHSGVKAALYPYSYVYGFYLFVIVYVYFVMPKLNKEKAQQSAAPDPKGGGASG